MKKESDHRPEPHKRVAECPLPDKEITYEEWAQVIHDNFPDLLPAAKTALSAITQLLVTDVVNPFALVLVDVPSSGKTIAINFFARIPQLTYASDKFTPASFVSNAANVKKEKLAQVDLLPRIQYKMLLIRDFATLFSKREEDLKEAIGTLTRVLDGEGLNTDSGVHGQRGYEGEYLFMLLAASTPIRPRVWEVMGTLGSRLFFLNIGSREKTEEELVQQVSGIDYKTKERACQQATKNFLFTLWNRHPNGAVWNKGGDDKEAIAIIARCAKLLANLRGVMTTWREEFDGGYKYEQPLIERPDRIHQLFYNHARGHAIACGRSSVTLNDLQLLFPLVLDSAPYSRANLFKKLLQYGGSMSTTDVERELNCSKTTARAEMKKLEILKVCTADERGRGESEITLADDFKWFLSEECKKLRGGESQYSKSAVVQTQF